MNSKIDHYNSFASFSPDLSPDESFYIHVTSNYKKNLAVETLINYISSRDYSSLNLKEFEDIIVNLFIKRHDSELAKLLRNHGWTGSKFVSNSEFPFDFNLLSQSLSNLYIKQTSCLEINSNSFYNDGSKNTSKDSYLDGILSFCPDILVEYLDKLEKDSILEPTGIITTGACMLVDISGFSKFSASMCLLGVDGLDRLRNVTNGFLGYFVNLVYEFGGDGKLFIIIFPSDFYFL